MIILVLIIAAIVVYARLPGKYDYFAKCLTEKGVKMYGTDSCSHCQNQKHDFGKSFKYVDFTNCNYAQSVCNLKGITGYPTWIVEEKSYPGEQSFQRLSELTGCLIEK